MKIFVVIFYLSVFFLWLVHCYIPKQDKMQDSKLMNNQPKNLLMCTSNFSLIDRQLLPPPHQISSITPQPQPPLPLSENPFLKRMGCLTSGKKYFGIVYGVPEIKILEMIRVEEENNGMQLVIA